MKQLDIKMSTNLFCGTMFLTTGGQWTRLLHCAKNIVESRLEVTYSVVKPEWKLFSEQLSLFMLRNERKYNVEQTLTTGNEKQLQMVLMRRLEEFLRIFNGPLWGERWVHHCRRDGRCCPGRTHEERVQHAKAAAVHAVRNVIFRRKPARPAENKWTKLSPAYDFWGVGFMAHKILPVVASESLKAVKVKYEAAAGADADRMLEDNVLGSTR